MAVLPLHHLNHALEAFRVRDVGRDADCLAAGAIDGVDDGDVGVGVAGEEDDGVGGGEFAGDGGASLWDFDVSVGDGKEGMERKRTPGPTPAMMAMCLPGMVFEWETRERRREVGCMDRWMGAEQRVWYGWELLDQQMRGLVGR